MTIIPFAEWRPDMPALGQWAREALNVVPAEESYRPLNALSGVSNALGARAQGAAWFRGTAGATKMFAGDASKLYLLDGTTWTDVTRREAGKNISAISVNGPTAAMQVTAHGYSPGDQIYVSGVVGMTQINGTIITVSSLNNANNFNFTPGTAGFSAYVSGGTAQRLTAYAPGGDNLWRFTQFGTLAILSMRKTNGAPS